jgi:pyridoxal phosphate enzyme (YggS family)
MTEHGIGDAVSRVRERVSSAAERSGRDAGDVRIVAVTKGVGVDSIKEAADAGVADFGENRARDLRQKAESVGGSVRWHFLGALQTNKVRYLDRAWLIHGLDRIREADALQTRGDRAERTWDVLVEVNIARDGKKAGVAPELLGHLLGDLAAYPRVRPRGLMFVAPQVENVEDVRAMFAEARALRERFAEFGLDELSMGMSDDYEVAVEEGSTIVRIGRAIFRPTLEGM